MEAWNLLILKREKDLLIPPPKQLIEDCDTKQKSFIPQQESNIQDCDTKQKSFIPQQESNIQDSDTKQKSFIPQPKNTSLVQEAKTYNLRIWNTWTTKSPEKEKYPPKSVLSKGRQTLNSLKAGLLDPNHIEKLKDKFKSKNVKTSLEKELTPVKNVKKSYYFKFN